MSNLENMKRRLEQDMMRTDDETVTRYTTTCSLLIDVIEAIQEVEQGLQQRLSEIERQVEGSQERSSAPKKGKL